MKAVTKILAGGVGLAALASAAPAAAQYYPGYGYGGGGDVVGQVLGNILGGNRYGYGQNDRYLVDRCAAAVQQRIDRQYGYNGGYSPYGYNNYAYGNARVLGISRVERRSSGLRVRGVATANANAGYGYNPYGGGYGGGYGGYAQPTGELTFKCNIDFRGRITDIDLDRSNYAYGYPYGRR